MRPINLLPPYIYDKQKKVQLAAVWGILTVGVIGGFIYWQSLINEELRVAQDEKQQAETLKSQHDAENQKIAQENQKISEIKLKQEFIANAQKYNDQWAEGYSLIRDVTSPDVILRRITIDPGTRKVVSLAGAARREMDIVKWWMALRNDQERFDSVRFELPPHSYPGAGAGAGTAGTAGGGMAGMPGAPRGFGSGGLGPGGPGSGGGFGGRGALPQMSGAPGGPGGGGPGSFGGGFSGGPRGLGGGGFGGGAQSNEIGPGILEGRPVINFVATAVLKKGLAEGISLPSWPMGAGGGTGTGGFGGASSFGPGGGPGSGGSFSGGPGGGGSPGGGSPGGGPRPAD